MPYPDPVIRPKVPLLPTNIMGQEPFNSLVLRMAQDASLWFCRTLHLTPWIQTTTASSNRTPTTARQSDSHPKEEY
jgi:hypothetical protein